MVPSVDSQRFCKDGVRRIASVLLYTSDGDDPEVGVGMCG